MKVGSTNASRLLNDGCLSLFENDRALPGERTVLVIGQARAGTTMVAAMLREMGVPVGERIGPVHEDNEMGAFVESFGKGEVPADFVQAVAVRDKAHPVWAWKRPDLYSCLATVTPELRNPRLVCILRDPAALALRNCISMSETGSEEAEALAFLGAAMDEQRAIFEAVSAAKLPTLLLSYEKALTRTDEFVAVLARFVGKELSGEGLRRLRGVVMPNHLGYALRAREGAYEWDGPKRGVLLGVRDGCLMGRVRLEAAGGERVAAWVDGLCVGETECLCEEGGRWGRVSFPLGERLKEDSHALQFTFVRDGLNFANSPYMWCRDAG